MTETLALARHGAHLRSDRYRERDHRPADERPRLDDQLMTDTKKRRTPMKKQKQEEQVINATQELLDELRKLDQSNPVVSLMTEHVEWNLEVVRHACTLSPEDAENYLKWKEHEARVRWLA
jgi:hypothetical protein